MDGFMLGFWIVMGICLLAYFISYFVTRNREEEVI